MTWFSRENPRNCVNKLRGTTSLTSQGVTRQKYSGERSRIRVLSFIIIVPLSRSRERAIRDWKYLSAGRASPRMNTTLDDFSTGWINIFSFFLSLSLSDKLKRITNHSRGRIYYHWIYIFVSSRVKYLIFFLRCKLFKMAIINIFPVFFFFYYSFFIITAFNKV